MSDPELDRWPCPFCGSEHSAIVNNEDQRVTAWCVECGSCAACGPSEDSPEAAVAAWNRR
jgi:Lar family restriction alleviation protein